MAEIQVETVIQRPIEAVFALIADLPNYGKWLPPSNTFKAVTEYSELPVKAGTRYTDGPMRGEVTTFEPPTRIGFRQQREVFGGGLDVEMRYTLSSEANGTRVIRQVTVRLRGGYWLLQPVVVNVIRKETTRILAVMKAYLEKSA